MRGLSVDVCDGRSRQVGRRLWAPAGQWRPKAGAKSIPRPLGAGLAAFRPVRGKIPTPGPKARQNANQAR